MARVKEAYEASREQEMAEAMEIYAEEIARDEELFLLSEEEYLKDRAEKQSTGKRSIEMIPNLYEDVEVEPANKEADAWMQAHNALYDAKMEIIDLVFALEKKLFDDDKMEAADYWETVAKIWEKKQEARRALEKRERVEAKREAERVAAQIFGEVA